MKIVKRLLGRCVLVTGITVNLSCSGDLTDARTAVSIRSPDGAVVAIILESNHGATVPYVYRLYLADPETRANGLEPDTDILRVDSLDDMDIRWLTPSNLLVTCVRGHVYKYTSVGETSVGRVRVDLSTRC